MKTKTLLGVLGILLPILNATAQQITPLNIGDTVPDFALPWYGNPQPEKLSDYKDKVVILDFWATWCGSCIGAMPHLEALEKAFAGKVKALPVTYEPEKTVRNYFQRKRNWQLNTVLLDTTEPLYKYFPHRLLPHTILIGPGGKVAAIANAQEITAVVIDTLLQGKPLALHVKKDILKFNPDLPLAENEQVSKDVLFSSMLTRHIDGLGSMSALQYRDGQLIGLNDINDDIVGLYIEAYGKPEHYRRSRLLFINVKDSLNYLPPRLDKSLRQAWDAVHSYCFAIQFGDGIALPVLRSAMQVELDRTFGRMYETRVRLETVWHPCYLLKKMEGFQPRHFEEKPVVLRNAGEVLFHAKTLDRLAASLEASLAHLPVVYEGKDTTTGDYHLAQSLLNTYNEKRDVRTINEALARYHLYLEPDRRPVEMLVIREEKHS